MGALVAVEELRMGYRGGLEDLQMGQRGGTMSVGPNRQTHLGTLWQPVRLVFGVIEVRVVTTKGVQNDQEKDVHREAGNPIIARCAGECAASDG